jgi:hypothetical protein
MLVLVLFRLVLSPLGDSLTQRVEARHLGRNASLQEACNNGNPLRRPGPLARLSRIRLTVHFGKELTVALERFAILLGRGEHHISPLGGHLLGH